MVWSNTQCQGQGRIQICDRDWEVTRWVRPGAQTRAVLEGNGRRGTGSRLETVRWEVGKVIILLLPCTWQTF